MQEIHLNRCSGFLATVSSLERERFARDFICESNSFVSEELAHVVFVDQAAPQKFIPFLLWFEKKKTKKPNPTTNQPGDDAFM